MMRNSLSALILVLGLAACETAPPPPPPPPMQAGPSPFIYRSGDFAWSAIPGGNRIDGRLVFRMGPTSFTCANVALIPEAPFSTRRMLTLYGSADGASLPVSEVQAHTTPAPAGFNDFVRATTCDGQGRFSFTGLPDGAWFALTLAQPTSLAGPPMALMRRVITRGGRATIIEL